MMETPLRRLRRKTTVALVVVAAAAAAVAAPAPAAEEEWAEEFLATEDLEREDKEKRKAVYLVTLPALRHASWASAQGAGLKCPSAWKHGDVARALQHAFRNPIRSHPRAAEQVVLAPVLLECFVIFRERHAPLVGEAQGLAHWHIALKAQASFRFLPYKKALRTHHGLASHWSTSHLGYWSAVRYGCMPSPKKPQGHLDAQPLAWSRVGQHAPLFEVCQEPHTAPALKRRRESMVKAAAEQGVKEPRATELDLYPIIIQHDFKNTPDDQTADKQLIKWVKANGSPALVSLVFRIRTRLAALIDDVWSWEQVDDMLLLLRQSRVQRLTAAAQEPCMCGGRWRQLAYSVFQANGISAERFCVDVLASLRDGRRPNLPSVVLMGRYGGEGKSFLFAPLRKVFGESHVQESPQPGSFPLLGLETKKVVLLDEWRFDSSVVPLSTQLLWLEGKPFPVTRPQNRDYDGHLLYRGTAPIFVTCKERDLGPIMAAADRAVAAGKPSQETMLLRRLRVYTLYQKLLVQPGEQVPECSACFASMVLNHGSPELLDS